MAIEFDQIRLDSAEKCAVPTMNRPHIHAIWKIPSEMEEAPRYHYLHCWNCLHCLYYSNCLYVCLSGWSEKHQNCKLQLPQVDFYDATALISEQFLESWLDNFPLAKLAKREVQTNKQTKIEKFNFHNQITDHVTVLISEQFLESWLDHFPLPKLAKREVHKMRKSPI